MPEEKKVFNLDRFRTQWNEYVSRKRQYNVEKAFLEQAGDLLKTLAGEAGILQVGGQEVAKIVMGQLNKALLAAEQPDIVKECTVTRTVESFDQDLFRQKYPDLFKQYQARKLVVDPKLMGPDQ